MTNKKETCNECVEVNNIILQQLGPGAHEEGCGTTASGPCSHAEGFMTLAAGLASHAEGAITIAGGDYSHSEGFQTSVTGIGAHGEGGITEAGGDYSHAEGFQTVAGGSISHAEGFQTEAPGVSSHAEGANTAANGAYSHAEGRMVSANGDQAHAEGLSSTATGDNSHAEGQSTSAVGLGSHAEGISTNAGGQSSHAEGLGTIASGNQSHAEGSSNTAIGTASHSEGISTSAVGDGSHAEGSFTNAGGFASHAEGQFTTASGDISHAEGLFTSTNGFDGAHIMGIFGQATDPYSWFLANGTGPGPLMGIGAKIIRNDPLQPGVTNAYIDGAWIPGGADYAEMFETVDGQPIEPGYFVTLKGKKIRKAKADDDYILGVTSANYSVLANSGELRWKGKYLTDEWGRVQRQEVLIPAVNAEDGRVIVQERKENQPVLNPAWDNTREYIPRLKRPEWVAVGLVGQILARDDGTCEVDNYCGLNDEGVATASATGYRVLERTGPNQILILFR